MIDHFIGQTLAGKYRIEERWREDAASKTYRATQVLLDKPVTLKILNPALARDDEAASRFQQEAKVLSRISDPHILNVLDFGQDEHGISFLALENATGKTLREHLRENAGAPLAVAVSITNQIARALAHAHRSQVVHGNLSSDRILIDDERAEPNVKILDFAELTSQNMDAEQTLVRADLPIYRAPEQFQTGETADARSDIYALGALVYEIFTTKPPFVADSAEALANKHLNEIPPSLIAARPDLPPAMEQVVQRALAKNPNQRFQTADEFSAALENAANGNSPELARHAVAGNFNSAGAQPPISTGETGNNPYKTAFIVLAGICLLSAVGIFITGGFRNTPTQTVNADPNAQPAQPINPVSGNVENPGDLTLNPLNNGNLDPYAIPSGAYPGGVPGAVVPGGGVNPPYPEGRIPPGLPFDTRGGQQVPPTTQGEPGNPFTTDYYPVPVNSNVRPPVGNTNAATNANARPAGNTNAAPPRPANANTGGAATATPQPTAAPTQAPAKPRPSPAAPATTQPAPKSNSNSAAEQSNLE